jgi:hippurate hydrolase
MTDGGDLENEMAGWRHHLHAYPETGFEEFQTSDFVAGKLTALGLEVHRGIGGTGVVATLRAGGGNRAIGLPGECAGPRPYLAACRQDACLRP